VEEEGRSARNLVTWNVPLEMAEQKSVEQSSSTKSSGASPVLSRRLHQSDHEEHKRQGGQAFEAHGRHGSIQQHGWFTSQNYYIF